MSHKREPACQVKIGHASCRLLACLGLPAASILLLEQKEEHFIYILVVVGGRWQYLLTPPHPRRQPQHDGWAAHRFVLFAVLLFTSSSGGC